MFLSSFVEHGVNHMKDSRCRHTCSKKQEFVKEIEKLGKCGYYLVSLRALLKKLIQEVKNSLDLF